MSFQWIQCVGWVFIFLRALFSATVDAQHESEQLGCPHSCRFVYRIVSLRVRVENLSEKVLSFAREEMRALEDATEFFLLRYSRKVVSRPTQRMNQIDRLFARVLVLYCVHRTRYLGRLLDAEYTGVDRGPSLPPMAGQKKKGRGYFYQMSNMYTCIAYLIENRKFCS